MKKLSIEDKNPCSLFTTRGKEWKEEKVRSVFQKLCHNHGMNVGFQEYRQAFTALFRKYGKVSSSSRWLQTVHEQAGHTSETAECAYGITQDDSWKIGSETLLGFFEVSQCWHRLLNMTGEEWIEAVLSTTPSTNISSNQFAKKQYASLEGHLAGLNEQISMLFRSMEHLKTSMEMLSTRSLQGVQGI